MNLSDAGATSRPLGRICHVLHGIFSTDPRVRRQVAALVEAGYAVDILCLHEDGDDSEEGGIRVYRAPVRRARGSVLRYVLEYLAFFIYVSLWFLTHLRVKYDVIHVSNMPDFLVFSALLPKLRGSKVLLDVHDPMPELFCSKYGLRKNSAVVRLLAWQERVSVRFADAVLTVSEEMRERLERSSRSKRISVVMNLPHEQMFEHAVPRIGHSVEPGVFRILYTGTISERYGLDLVVDALPILRKRIPGIVLRLVGEGDQLPSLREQVAELGVQDAVEFCGRVPLTQISRMIAEADLGVSALVDDLHTDLCFVTKVAEYVALGLPTVVSRTRTMVNYYSDELVAFYEPGDPTSFESAVMRLYSDEALRAEMSQKGIEFGRIHNWSVEKRYYVDLVEELRTLGRLR